MVKKIIVMLIIAIVSLSCSRLQVKDDKPQDPEFLKHYNSWEIEEMEKVIQEYVIIDGYTPETLRYKSMFEDRKIAKQELEILISKVRSEMLENNLATLQDNMSTSVRNKATIRELRKVDFRGFRIYTSKVSFNSNRAANIVALNLGEETFYYDVNYEYKKEKWEIVDFKERR